MRIFYSAPVTSRFGCAAMRRPDPLLSPAHLPSSSLGWIIGSNLACSARSLVLISLVPIFCLFGGTNRIQNLPGWFYPPSRLNRPLLMLDRSFLLRICLLRTVILIHSVIPLFIDTVQFLFDPFHESSHWKYIIVKQACDLALVFLWSQL